MVFRKFRFLDEVSAIVFDLGSHSCRSGYAGEDQPKSVFPSVILPLPISDLETYYDSIS